MLAQDIMTRNVVTARPETPLAEALTHMLDGHISGLPVVDEAGHLVGMLTEGDLLHRHETDTETHRSGFLGLLLGPGYMATEYVQAHGREVRDVMTENPVGVTEDTSLADIVKLMQKRRFKRVPVLRNNVLVGIVSRSDIVRLLAQKLAAPAAPAPHGDEAIRNAVTLEIASAKWASAHNVTVSVKDGVVTLEGVIFNEAVRPALRVAAENTPGVVRVEDHLVWVEPVTGAALGA